MEAEFEALAIHRYGKTRVLEEDWFDTGLSRAFPEKRENRQEFPLKALLRIKVVHGTMYAEPAEFRMAS